MTRAEAEHLLALLQRGRAPLELRGRTQLDDLAARVRQVVAWCAPRLDDSLLATVLRPSHLAPHPLAASRWEAVDDVARARAQELRAGDEARAVARGGRWLVYFPDCDLADGAAAQETHGWFDVHNAPPWGTWLGYFEDGTEDASLSAYLVAWVPAGLVPLVQRGIDVNPESCIVWIEDTQVRLREVVAHVAGLEVG